MREAKARFNPDQLVLGLGPNGWVVLGNVDPYTLLTPKLLFRKVLKPKAAHDYSYYYHCVIIVNPWTHASPGARLGARGWRVLDGIVTEIYQAGEATLKANDDGQIYYEMSVLFDTGEAADQ